MDFLKRHRRKFVGTGVFLTGGYALYRSVALPLSWFFWSVYVSSLSLQIKENIPRYSRQIPHCIVRFDTWYCVSVQYIMDVNRSKGLLQV